MNGLCLRLYDDAQLIYSKKPKSLNLVFKAILCIIGFVSSVTMFEGFFHFGLPIFSMVVYALAFLLFAVAFHLAKSRTIKLSIAGLLIMNLLFLIFNEKKVVGGACILIYEYIKFIKRDYYFIEDTAKMFLEEYGRSDCILYFSLAVSLIVIFLLVYAVLLHSNFILGFLATFPFFELGMYWGVNTYILSLLGLVVFWVSLMAVQLITFTVRKGSKQNTFVFIRSKDTYQFTSTEKGKFPSTQIGILIIIICFISFLLIAFGAKVFNYSRPEILNSYRYHISYTIRNFSFEDVVNEIKEEVSEFFTPESKRYVGGISNGNIGEVEKIEYKNIKALEVTLSNKPLNTIYLRSYAAGVYKGDEWDPLPSKVYNKNKSIFENARLSIVFLSNISSNVLFESSFNQVTNFPIEQMTIKNLTKDNKVIFFPNLSVINEGYLAHDDTDAVGDNSVYTYSFLNSNTIYAHTWNELMNNASASTYSTKYNSLLDDYTKFVYANYLEFDSKKYPEIYSKFSKFRGTNDLIPLVIATQGYLWDQASYTRSPGKTPDSEDFINYFLYENHKGYCSHFASAGVMIFRCAGIPARYVEGYIATPDSFEKQGDSFVATLRDNSAHAWVEIYVDNLGWLPVELTPGGYNMNSNPNESLQPEAPQTPENESVTNPITTRPADTDVQNQGNGGNNSNSNSGNNSGNNSGSIGSNGGSSGIFSNQGSVGSTTQQGGNNGDINSSQNNSSDNMPQKEPLWPKIKASIDEFIENNREIIMISSYVILCFVLIICIIFIRRRVILAQRKRKIFSSDKSLAVRYMFSDIQNVLRLWGYESENISEIELIEKLDESNKILAKHIFMLYSIASKAKFSNHSISDDDWGLALSYYDRVLKFTKMRLSKIGKLSYKYIFVFGYKN